MSVKFSANSLTETRIPALPKIDLCVLNIWSTTKHQRVVPVDAIREMNPGNPDTAAFDLEDFKHADPAVMKDLLGGVDVGIAVFGPDLKLEVCNTRYMLLCNYVPNDVLPGTSFTDLIALSLKRQGQDRNTIESTVQHTLEHIRERDSYHFQFATIRGTIDVTRRRLPSGRIVETIREAGDVTNTTISGQLQQTAEIAKTRMMQALDIMADGFVLYDSHDRIVAFNHRFVELNSHVASFIMPGALFETTLVEAIRCASFNMDGMSPEDFIKLQLKRHRNPGEPHELQLANGRWLLVSEKRTDDGGTVGLHSDITELKQREVRIQEISRELSVRNAHFQSALDNMIQGLCMFDADQKLIVCNHRYLDMYGFSPEVVKPGIALRDIMEYSISLGNYTKEEAERALSERPDPNKLRERTTIKQYLRDGRVIAVMNEPMANNGSIATYQDITELETHEKKQVLHMKQLERSNRELQDFAYVASHDLQEPLRKIEAFGDRLASKYSSALPDDGKMFIDRMQNAAFRMRALINDLLSYSRVTTKAKPFQSVDVKQVIDGVLSDLQVRIEETKADITVGDLPTIEADPTQLRQLFQNLLSNALKFRKEDAKPIIGITAQPVQDTGPEPVAKTRYRFTVEDNGIGFDNQYKDQIFTIFQRLHGRLEFEGTGVGLATCRKIVERHGGIMDADGRPGEGSTFIFELPECQTAEGLAQA